MLCFKRSVSVARLKSDFLINAKWELFMTHTVVVPCLCMYVCVAVRSFLPPRASRPRNIGTYVFTATRKKIYNRDFR